MKLAVLSDIHGNFVALKECLNFIDQNHFDGVVFLGDYITDCPYPHKTIELIRQTMAKYKTWVVRGNREQYIIDYCNKDIVDWCYSSQTGSLLYTYENLANGDVNFISNLPITLTVKIEGCSPFIICHGSPDNLKDKLKPNSELAVKYLQNLEVDYLVCGHTHKPFIFNAYGKSLINPGSVGCPINGQTMTQFSSFEFINNRWENETISLIYDIEKLVKAFESSGILEVGKMWSYSMIKLIKTGENYPMQCLYKAFELAEKDGSNETTEHHWRQAAKELGII